MSYCANATVDYYDININIVECKYCKNHQNRFPCSDININIVECKLAETLHSGVSEPHININIVECKSVILQQLWELIQYKYKHSGM